MNDAIQHEIIADWVVTGLALSLVERTKVEQPVNPLLENVLSEWLTIVKQLSHEGWNLVSDAHRCCYWCRRWTTEKPPCVWINPVVVINMVVSLLRAQGGLTEKMELSFED